MSTLPEHSPRMPPAAYAQLEGARSRAQYRAIVRSRTRARRRRTLWAVILVLMFTLGALGLLLTKPIPGIG